MSPLSLQGAQGLPRVYFVLRLLNAQMVRLRTLVGRASEHTRLVVGMGLQFQLP